MYINYEIMTAKLLSLHDLGVLTLIKQNRIADLSKEIEFEVQGSQILEKLSQMGYIESVKAKNKSQTQFHLLRTSKLGNDVLESIEIPEVTENDLKLFGYLSQIYLSHEDTDRVIGNAKKVKLYCVVLRNHLQMSLHEFYYFLEYFLAEYPFTKKLENLFLDPNKNRYGSFINNIDDSPIFQFWQREEQNIRQYWQQKIKE